MYGSELTIKEQHGEKDDGVYADIYISNTIYIYIYISPLTLCHIQDNDIHCHCIHNLRIACEKYENAAMLIMMNLPCILW